MNYLVICWYIIQYIAPISMALCGPFVGVDHHCKIIMFRCKFLKNETTSSFTWLFKTFLSSVEGKHQVTLMSGQCAAMAKAIREVFSIMIGENSKKHINRLRSKVHFVGKFTNVLKYTHKVIEFKYNWNRYFTIHYNGILVNIYGTL